MPQLFPPEIIHDTTESLFIKRTVHSNPNICSYNNLLFLHNPTQKFNFALQMRYFVFHA
jgi:hypothetical protein